MQVILYCSFNMCRHYIVILALTIARAKIITIIMPTHLKTTIKYSLHQLFFKQQPLKFRLLFTFKNLKSILLIVYLRNAFLYYFMHWYTLTLLLSFQIELMVYLGHSGIRQNIELNASVLNSNATMFVTFILIG